MIEAHEHDWTPVPGECARYACACGGVGYRDGNGRIHEIKHATDLDRDAQITAWPIADYHTGRVRVRIPNDWEFWETQQEL